MTETYHVVQQVREGVCLLKEPNKVLFTSKSLKDATDYFNTLTKGHRVYPYEFDKGIYVLLSEHHYLKHPKALYIIHENTFPV